MAEKMVLVPEKDMPITNSDKDMVAKSSEQPSLVELQSNLEDASRLVDDIVLKKYLYRLNDLDIIPLDEELKKISDIRIFKINEMVYQNDEYSTYKFETVFNAVQNLNCGVFIIADSNGKKTDFYMGVRSLDNKRTTKSLKDTLRNALLGQFPGVKTVDLLDPTAEDLISTFSNKNIASISCVAKNKDKEFKNNESFIQGLEKLIIAMQGQKYTIIVLAKSTSANQLEELRKSYETIYTQLSPYANMQLSYGVNTAISLSDALSNGTTTGKNYSRNKSFQVSSSHQEGFSESHSVSKPDMLSAAAKSLGTVALSVASLATAPLTGGASIAAATAISFGQVGLNSISPKTYSDGTTISESDTVSHSTTNGESFGTNNSSSSTITKTKGHTTGSSNNMMLTMQNKNLMDKMEKIEMQIKRIDECESVGMWECAAYILSDKQETVEMAAGTYKALMKGENSGVETSAINFWGKKQREKIFLLKDYITNFIHPVFEYPSEKTLIPVTASSLVSGNELAIHMGLPRKSVCGFPVIEHAEFGKEVVRYDVALNKDDFQLGHVFGMGEESNTDVMLDCNSLTMHTFITGSTGSGKSNTVYEILNQLRTLYRIPFLVIEPAKGEYKNIFGQYADVNVYGTNPNLTNLLRINPFSFPKDIHVLEHIDRLVEIFNVCWPMYAAMPVILKEALERAYISNGWDINRSVNDTIDRFPNFIDLLEQIKIIINESHYSSDSKADYSGALMTRVRSLSTGLNGQIFSNESISDYDLFDKCVIIDLSRIGSLETKSLIMGLLVMKLNEYRMVSGRINSPLKHITVLEEAHNLLKRTSINQSSDNSNLIGKSVELLSNSIAEMRTYGEGFIIADQSPGLLDLSVIRNTNTKIILRLPDRQDRELVGFSASLNENQISELAKLKKGVAAVYQNNWVEPILVQINKCDISEKMYNFKEQIELIDNNTYFKQLIYFIIQGRVNKKLLFDINEINLAINKLGLSAKNQNYFKNLISEYRDRGTIELWNNDHFTKLSNIVTDILNVRNQVESIVISSSNNIELTVELSKLLDKQFTKLSAEVKLTLVQCFMKDMSVQKGDSDIREKIYKYWFDSITEGCILV